MQDFLETLLSLPTVVFTTGLGIVLVYWLIVIMGALDIDAFGVDADLDLDADLDVDLDVGDVGEGADVGEVDGADADSGDDHGASALATLLTLLRLRHAPLTVTLSVLTLSSWFFCYLGARLVMPQLPLGPALGSVLVGVGAVLLSLPVASLLTRPLGPLFVLHLGKSKKSFVGGVCTVRTGQVDLTQGQALIQDGGAGLLVRVRCDDPTALKRGDEAIIIGYDPEQDVYDVQPLAALLPETGTGRSD